MNVGDEGLRAAIARMTAGEIPAPSGNSNGLPKVPGYSLHRLIGHGAQGSVYAATSNATDRLVAIKLLAGGINAESRKRRRFQREARLLARLQHPNIVSVLDYGRTPDGGHFIAMDYVNGRPIDSESNVSTFDGVNQGIDLFLQVCRAVEYAHQNDVVHRDLKPHNILVTDHGVRVLDFGLAYDSKVTAERYTQTGEVMGSLPWSSPEQVGGKKAGVQTDIYALGTLLYRITSGRMPIEPHISIAATVDAIRNGDVIPWHTSAPVPNSGGLAAIIARSMAVNLRHRYASLSDLIFELEQWRTAQPVIRYQPRLRRFCYVAAISILLGGGVWMIRSAANQRPAQSISQPHYVNSLGMKMILIPRGEAGSGKVSGKPAAYWIAELETTRGQFRQVMGWPDGGDDDQAVSNVSYEDATEFCRRLREKEQAVYRLPTETEWENACRVGFPMTSSGVRQPTAQIAWSSVDSLVAPQRAAQKSPNLWGLHDMLGNVAEWCIGSNLVTTDRPVRGGSFADSPADIGMDARQLHRVDYRAPNVGFRIISENLESLSER